MRKIVLSIVFLMAGMAMFAALPGTTCGTAIPLGDNYSEQISGPYPKSIWYTARTFDLPLTVTFTPTNGASDPRPLVEMDFSCQTGIYTDDIICSLFCPNSGSGIQLDMPHKPALKTGTDENGDFCYYLAMGKEYRDLLLKAGIDYNVDVFVKVTYQSGGTISIAPDDMFTNCMAAKFMHFGDTIHVKAQDGDRHVIVPYVQWQEDSIRYVWISDQPNVPCTLAIANKCDFDPRDYADGDIIDRNFDGSDTLKVTSALLHDYVTHPDYPNEAGMYFVKCYSESTGILKVEPVPMAPPQGDATLLRYEKSTPVLANNLDALYAIPFTWDTATIFTTPTDHIFRMYIGTTHDFTTETAIASYQFKRDENGHWLGLTTDEMRALWTSAISQYLYVRFECSAKTTITPNRWDTPICLEKAIELKRPSAAYEVEKGSYGAVYYRFYYRDWKNGNMTFEWTDCTTTCPTFVGRNCTFAANRYDEDVLDFQTIAKNGSWIVAADDIEEWSADVDTDGYLYVRFNPGAQGTMVVSTNAPDEVDPAPIVYPAASISVVCNGDPDPVQGQQFVVRVAADQMLNLYSGPADNIASRTPLQTWSQTASETHNITLQSGIYTLVGTDDSVQIEVK